jgi:hypothetical protein
VLVPVPVVWISHRTPNGGIHSHGCPLLLPLSDRVRVRGERRALFLPVTLRYSLRSPDARRRRVRYRYRYRYLSEAGWLRSYDVLVSQEFS